MNDCSLDPIFCSIQNIMYFNNQGVINYENSNFGKAKEYFQSAASHINSLREHFDQLECIIQPRFQNMNGSPIKGWSKPLYNTKQDGSAVIFTRAIIMNDYECPPDNANYYFLLNGASIAVLYNMSLLNHMMSDSMGQISSAINIAYNGYDESFDNAREMFGNLPLGLFSFHLKVLIFALYNNMGALYHNNLSRSKEASECFRAARKQLNENDLLHSMLQQNLLTPKEVHDFSINMVAVMFTTMSSAA